jgi:hypothetical protein
LGHNRTHGPQQKPGYLITAVATAISVGRTSMPSALAVFGSMANSNLICTRHVGWLRALESLAGIDANLSKQVRDIGSVAH